MFTSIHLFLIMLLIACVCGYVFVVIKEKLNLKNNVIIIDNKYVTQDHLDETDMKEFIIDGTRLKAGDEIKVFTHDSKSFIGTIIGAIYKEKSILMVTHSNEIIRFSIDNISKFKIISKYGKFFS